MWVRNKEISLIDFKTGKNWAEIKDVKKDKDNITLEIEVKS
jgi:hypothetical protein